eukprot:Hpha_TRINITY_DN33950_c0_g1::TRINITY_DN33950_c0_g1_i1::g.69467::m.69467
MSGFRVRVACELNGGDRHNALFLFEPPPGSLTDIVREVEQFYQKHDPNFSVGLLHRLVQGPSGEEWAPLCDSLEVADGDQLFASPRPANAEEGDDEREEKAFQELDGKGDGVVDPGEMAQALEGWEVDVRDLFLLADEDGDGVVSRREFSLFAGKFPAVVDALHFARVEKEAEEAGERALRNAEAVLEEERLREHNLEAELNSARVACDDAISRLRAHRQAVQEAHLHHRPHLEEAQRALVERELAHLSERTRLREEGLFAPREILRVASPPHSVVPLAPAPAEPTAPPSEYSSSLPGFSAISAGQPALAEGSEVEAYGFAARPEYNGLRGRVTGPIDATAGTVPVRFAAGQGECLVKMPLGNIRLLPSSKQPWRM